MKLTLGASPCPNDCFIIDAIVHRRIDLEGLEFELRLDDVEALNRAAFAGRLDVTKLSYHAFAFCADRFLKSAGPTQSAELLKLTTNYERGSFLEKAGYTNLPGSTAANWGVGRACGDLLDAAVKK